MTPLAMSPAEVAPPPVDDEPLVVEPEPPVEAPEEPTGAVGEPLAPDVPSRATELPFAVTGGDPGVVTWLPPPVDDDPLVVEPEPPVEPPEEPPDELAGATDEPVLLELPSTATELPLAVTGGDTGAVTWLPPPVEDEPLVVEPEVLPAELVGAADEPVLFEVPSTATELPLATTGAATEVVAWLPPRVLFAPVVPDCAEA